VKLQGERWLTLAVCVALAAIVWIVFGQTLKHDFVNYDDDAYVHLQPEIVGGVTLHGVGWAFTHIHSGNWHPLTSISHMLDCQLCGLNARGHHLTNLLLHAMGAILLFLALREMTQRLWRSAFVAALFAIHPLRVESVAWIAERKDVLSGVLFMLTLLAYTRYARRPSLVRYLTMAALFACGLMSKPMLVTLPCVLLLLDYWPLKRVAPLKQLILEKLPLVILSAGSGVVTILAQTHTMRSLEVLPISARFGNAFVAVVTYIGQMIWPTRLAVLYPLPDQLPLWKPMLAAAVVCAVTVLAVRMRRTRPYLAVGWFWYLGMLVPVLGILQVGMQSHADRYTYLPQIGLSLGLTWMIAELSVAWKYRRPMLSGAVAVLLVALMKSAAVQASYWRDSETLWRHTLAVTTRNSVAHTNLGNTLPARDALPHYEAALAIAPDSTLPLNNLAWILATAPEVSLRDGQRAVQLAGKANQLGGGTDPNFLRTLAVAYAEVGRFADAIQTAEHALPLAEAQGDSALAFDLRNNIAGYRLNEPVRDPSLAR
jgi:protein O-mannosyl-transferase